MSCAHPLASLAPVPTTNIVLLRRAISPSHMLGTQAPSALRGRRHSVRYRVSKSSSPPCRAWRLAGEAPHPWQAKDESPRPCVLGTSDEGAMAMGVKTRRVFVRVTEDQHHFMREKARSYGVSLSRLVLLAVEAYVRSYGEELGDSQLVVVNYGVWSGVDRCLGRIECVLRESAQQMMGVRWALTSGVRAGVLEREEAERAYAALKGCRDDVANMREAVERCTKLMDRVCEKAHLVDPYLGPLRMPGDVTADDGAGDEALGEEVAAEEGTVKEGLDDFASEGW